MPSGVRKFLQRLGPSSSQRRHGSIQAPAFDPFDPIHNEPREVDLPEIVDHNFMVESLKQAVAATERLSAVHPKSRIDDLGGTPWSAFFAFCEACKGCILSGKCGDIGTLKWFNDARRAQLERDAEGTLSLCYVCWAVLRVRLLRDDWSAGDATACSDYTVAAEWNPSGMMDSIQIGCVMFFDGQLPFKQEVLAPRALDTTGFTETYMRLISPSEPKFDMINSWLDDCRGTHGSGCNTPLIDKDMDRNLTLIDVKQRCLVKALGTSRFVALSYVWGKKWQLLHVDSNHDTLFRPGGLDDPELAMKSNAPLGKVVADSMAITAKIGERYLWIDALCIKQDDLEDKALEINRMASIYSCASVTIVPVENTSVHSPIPGLGQANRGGLSEPIIGGLSISVRDRLLTVIASSHYNTRGWCFQEAALSRRTLYFSSQQVFFRCQESIRSEDSVEQWIWEFWAGQHKALTSLGIINDIAEWKLPPQQARDREAQRRFFEGYDNVVGQYWRRNLTDDSDIMDAFSAIGAALEVHLGTRISAGLPENVFHHALLWNVRTPMWGDRAWMYPGSSRLSMKSAGGDLIPSWSWMGWRKYCCGNDDNGKQTGPLLMVGGLGYLSLLDGIVPLISGLQVEHRGDARAVEVFSEIYDVDTDWSKSCPHIGLRPEVVDTSLEDSGVIPGHNVLRFWATMIPLKSLGITFRHRAHTVGRGNPDLYGEHIIVDAGHSGGACGKYSGIAVNDQGYDIYQRLEVVVLSSPVWKDTAATVHKLADDGQRVFDSAAFEVARWKSLYFMLVCWAEGEGDRVCERFGVGEIHVDVLARGVRRTERVRLI